MAQFSQPLEAREGSRKPGLALVGGSSVRNRKWPKWPRADATTQRSLLDVLHSTKWTLSGQSDRGLSYERRFGMGFAAFCGTAFGVPCGSGTAALTMALQALAIGPGDEVILPGLTWVACASAVCNVGAIPILADVDPETLCLSPGSVRDCVTERSRAIMLVHLYSSLAPAAAINRIAAELGMPVIEDASQAHGARLDGRRTGSLGTIAAFSMQQSKLLAAGEGGICLTDDPALYRRLQQLRADGRIYADERGPGHEDKPFQEIAPCGEAFGRNLCMSEFQAAILLDRLELLDVENDHRHRNFEHLRSLLSTRPDIGLVTGAPADSATHYRICLRLSDDILRDLDIGLIARALAAELALPVEPIDSPLNDNPLYQPLRSPLVSRLAGSSEEYDPKRFDLPVARDAASRCLTLPHWSLMGDRTDLEDIAAALDKVLIEERGELATIASSDRSRGLRA
jgi:dTDP-4-amino-4,6-dideoxygalactose transaminase